MPFTRTQSVLKMLLPEWGFRLLYDLAYRGYIVWGKISDEIYYLLAYIYYIFSRDFKNLKKIRTIYSMRPYTMVDRTGLLATYDTANEVEKNRIDGCFVECGVARGGCSALMAIVANENKSDRKVWLFDSFEGLPEPSSEDEPTMAKSSTERRYNKLYAGSCLGTYDEVNKLLFSTLRLNKNNVLMVKGWFQDTLPRYKDKIGWVSFLRIDADWYESTKCCLEKLYDNVITGGYILIDDYMLPGCSKAVDEFLQRKGVDVKFTYDDRGGAYFVKPY